MRKLTIEAAIKAVENKFQEFTAILDVDTTTIIDIIVKDLSSNKFYEVYSDEDWTKLKIVKINL